MQKKGIALTILSAILLILAFPGFNLWILAWVAFVPFMMAIREKTPKQAFLLGYLCGIIFFAGTIYWLSHVTVAGLIILVLYLSLYFGVFGALVTCLGPRPRQIHAGIGHSGATVFILPAIWVGLEFIRANILSGFGWALLGYSQWLNLPIIQIADITGVYGVSFLIMLVNIAIACAVVNRRAGLNLLYGLLFVVALIVFYGFIKLNAPAEGEPIKISIIQGNVPQHEKWDPDRQEAILEKYTQSSIKASLDEPQLIIWPETAVPADPYYDPKSLEHVLGLARQLKTPILAGIPFSTSFEDYFNSAVLISNKGKVFERYDKMRLVPFGEYVPFEKYLGFVRGLAPAPIGSFKAGERYTVFELEKGTRYLFPKKRYLVPFSFSTLICFEDIFPDLSREFVKRGARMLVNITNDAWFGKTAAAYQHAQASVFRAVENRVPVVRCANTGYSVFIDSAGRQYGSIEDNSGCPLFIAGYSTETALLAPIKGNPTLYTRFGDLFAMACLGLLLLNSGFRAWNRIITVS